MWADAEFPADPYPGAVPPASFVHVDEVSHRLRPGPWRVGEHALDRWLAERGAAPAAARIPVLAYGSNRCPSKITWLRRELGLGADPVVVLRVRTTGLAAVWAAGLRYRDGQRPAVLVAAPGVREEHAVWLATPAQIEVLDRCEGRDDRFRLARLPTGDAVTVRAEDGARARRSVVLPRARGDPAPAAGGTAARCAAPSCRRRTPASWTASRARATGWTRPPSSASRTPTSGRPPCSPTGCCSRGSESWRLVAPHALGPPRPASVPGAVFDTGRGYPAWRPDGSPARPPAWWCRCANRPRLLPALDAYEGAEYQRVRVATADGTVCWAYAWAAATRGLRPLPTGWATRPG